ncbi:MAG: aldo/keto reductase [Candidatus Sumerlaeia bacterium]|nr:aldo/keto reductase [Candidatus Sumerlaeia bacterium]
MEYITLGHSTLQVSRMGFGCMGMSEFYGGIRNDNASIKVLHEALDQGINFFDTADMYGSGHNEELLKQAFADRWSKVIVATKFGNVRGPNGEFLGVNGKPEYIRECCNKSLRLLGIETIDLYYQHRPDPNVPIEDSIGTMRELVEEGKVRFLGISEFSSDQIRRAQKVHPISALQTEYSLWSREVESNVLETCRELGISFIAYSPLGRGFLTGSIPDKGVLDAHDWRRTNPRFTHEATEKNRVFVELIQEVASQKKATPAQIALAWVMAQGRDIIPIPGTRKIERLLDNLGALHIQFSDQELNLIRQKLPLTTVGTRY